MPRCWSGVPRAAYCSASKLPNRHVLAVELVRTFEDETAAIFTVVRNGEPIRTVVIGDAQGRVKAQQKECSPRLRAMMMADSSEESAAAAGEADGDPTPNFSLGRPPITQDPEPGIVALASALLPSAFNLGEHVDTSK